MRHLYPLLFILLSYSVFSQSSKVKIQDPAPWIITQDPDITAQIDENELSGYSYLLIDRQDNIIEKEIF